MQCPLLQKDCLEDECAWWGNEQKQCSILTYTYWLDNINSKLDNLDDELIDLGNISKNFVTAKQLNIIIGKLARAIGKT